MHGPITIRMKSSVRVERSSGEEIPQSLQWLSYVLAFRKVVGPYVGCRQDQELPPPLSPSVHTDCSFSGGQSDWDVKLTTLFHLAFKLRMSGPTILLPPFVFTACKETPLPSLPWVTSIIISCYSVSCYVWGERRTQLTHRTRWFASWALLVLLVPEKTQRTLHSASTPRP